MKQQNKNLQSFSSSSFEACFICFSKNWTVFEHTPHFLTISTCLSEILLVWVFFSSFSELESVGLVFELTEEYFYSVN